MSKLSTGFNQEKIQSMNRTLLLNLLRKEGVCSRAHLASISQLKQATITYLINDFMKWNIVKETGLISGNKGRRSIGITINDQNYGVLAVRLARKNYSVGIFDLSGKVVELIRTDTPSDFTPEQVLSSIIEQGHKLIAKMPDRKILLIGMALPGPYSFKKGRIQLMTGVAGWDEIDIKMQMEEQFQIPVLIEQDANCGALAQFWYTDIPMQDELLVYIAVGQGIGAGIISNGEIVHGAIGAAGEIGHTTINFNGPKCSCGNTGCLETYCSSIVFTNKVNQAFQPTPAFSFKDAWALMQSKNPTVIDIYKDICDKLSIGIINIINSLNPSIIVIGDELCHVDPDLMLAQINKNVKEKILPGISEETTICTSFIGSGNDSIVHGAAVLAIKELFSNPPKYLDKLNI